MCDYDKDMIDDEAEETHMCECDCGCGNEATTKEEGTWLCDECSKYCVDEGGDVICSNMTDGFTKCHVCRQEIKWGPIFTGGCGASNYITGGCGCGKEAWRENERGGWGHYSFSPGEDDEDDNDIDNDEGDYDDDIDGDYDDNE